MRYTVITGKLRTKFLKVGHLFELQTTYEHQLCKSQETLDWCPDKRLLIQFSQKRDIIAIKNILKNPTFSESDHVIRLLTRLTRSHAICSHHAKAVHRERI